MNGARCEGCGALPKFHDKARRVVEGYCPLCGAPLNALRRALLKENGWNLGDLIQRHRELKQKGEA